MKADIDETEKKENFQLVVKKLAALKIETGKLVYIITEMKSRFFRASILQIFIWECGLH